MMDSSPEPSGRLVRLASASDMATLSRLLVQLYACEVPGMLRGDRDMQTELARRLLSSAPLGRRYVVVHDAEVVAMGSLATRDEPRPATPPGVLLAFPSILGVRDALGSYAGVLRAMLTVAAPPAVAEAQIHSVVVDVDARGNGAGTLLMACLERQATALGNKRATLQVLASNSTARAFYRARGYVDKGPPHGRVRTALALPSILMYKNIV